jgi:hypothetical protein
MSLSQYHIKICCFIGYDCSFNITKLPILMPMGQEKGTGRRERRKDNKSQVFRLEIRINILISSVETRVPGGNPHRLSYG